METFPSCATNVWLMVPVSSILARHADIQPCACLPRFVEPYARQVPTLVWTVLLVAAAASAVIDWWAVAVENRRLEGVAKPATMALLVGVAATIGDAPADVRAWLLGGAVLGFVGDVALLRQGDLAFMAGLTAFAVGHGAYVVAAVLVGFDVVWALPGVVFIALLLGYRFVGETVPGARDHGGPALGAAVLFYAFVISAMVVSAWATSALLAVAGAMLFAVSDWALGFQRFVRPLGRHGRLGVMVPYHVGQAALIVGLATA
jgi:uncharacterized membrane protein YhhN